MKPLTQLENPQPRWLWFHGGLWWFRHSHADEALEISSIIVREQYDYKALAIALGMGERSFRRLVEVALLLSPGVWMRMERAVAARRRLREGASIKSVAFELGFRHQGDFAVEFKRWHAVNPQQFLNNGKSGRPVEFWQENLND